MRERTRHTAHLSDGARLDAAPEHGVEGLGARGDVHALLAALADLCGVVCLCVGCSG